MADATKTAPAKAAPPPATVKVKISVAGTKGGTFRYQNGGLSQFRLDDDRDLTSDQAKQLAEFYVALVSEPAGK
jgi:hypothetical protein